jgi:SAM-dependent methyltransferase
MREYRETLAKGQTSPFYCGDYAIEKINQLYDRLQRPLSILDIGSGSGQMMKYIIDRVGKDKIVRLVGLDWSPTAVERLNLLDFYNQIFLCQSSKLPVSAKEFDIAISIENLEHLYLDDVIPAIQEMSRVAEHIIIVTPTPQDVINFNWLGREIPEAEHDTDPISDKEYQVLEGAVHKSVALPDSMITAGFEIGSRDHGRYFASSDGININNIIIKGIKPINDFVTMQDKYCKLLRASLGLHKEL